jgi:hypothetical protein
MAVRHSWRVITYVSKVCTNFVLRGADKHMPSRPFIQSSCSRNWLHHQLTKGWDVMKIVCYIWMNNLYNGSFARMRRPDYHVRDQSTWYGSYLLLGAPVAKSVLMVFSGFRGTWLKHITSRCDWAKKSDRERSFSGYHGWLSCTSKLGLLLILPNSWYSLKATKIIRKRCWREVYQPCHEKCSNI